MRRKDREMGREFALQIIDNSDYGVLSVIDADGAPYAFPLSLVRKEDSLYFHSAQGGKKVEIFKRNPIVTVVFVGKTKIPELFSIEELDSCLLDEKKGSSLASKVFTTEFESAITYGRIVLVNDKQEAIDALRLLCEKYTPSKMKYFEMAVRSGLSRTNIYRIDIESITAKRKKYDSKGEEMKWGRIE
ncbi:pyridoxamine 5'-phosphate oxidase family protein [Dysgonomonas massiliensis]|uniref:pyridoxamine 5'-phosphate oxidase family protein n=1 Tax=Dysgonomonas massiliensis TaxID=2040292 RepID=UPI000C7584C2|nr:pyridoxamine 5'-phosphate oxidase family protein [Dysgonomonas massiliensis]